MKRKEILEKRLARLEAKKANLAKRANESQDVAEVRSINDELAELNAEIEETKAEVEVVTAEEEERAKAAEGMEARTAIPAGATLVNPTVNGSFTQGATGSQVRENDDPFATMEYRKAFMRYAQTGEAIPANLIQRDGMPANTDTLGATIPTTVLNEFIQLIRKVYGNLTTRLENSISRVLLRFLFLSFRLLLSGLLSLLYHPARMEDRLRIL
jgi:HK97 family phage major capsid protein